MKSEYQRAYIAIILRFQSELRRRRARRDAGEAPLAGIRGREWQKSWATTRTDPRSSDKRGRSLQNTIAWRHQNKAAHSASSTRIVKTVTGHCGHWDHCGQSPQSEKKNWPLTNNSESEYWICSHSSLGRAILLRVRQYRVQECQKRPKRKPQGESAQLRKKMALSFYLKYREDRQVANTKTNALPWYLPNSNTSRMTEVGTERIAPTLWPNTSRERTGALFPLRLILWQFLKLPLFIDSMTYQLCLEKWQEWRLNTSIFTWYTAVDDD